MYAIENEIPLTAELCWNKWDAANYLIRVRQHIWDDMWLDESKFQAANIVDTCMRACEMEHNLEQASIGNFADFNYFAD